jgi:hypothetical protein
MACLLIYGSAQRSMDACVSFGFFYMIEQSCTAANQTIENELMTQQLY